MSTLPPSPFLSESSATADLVPRVSAEVEAAAPFTPPQLDGAAADTEGLTGLEIFVEPSPDSDDISDVHEIFHHGRRLVEEGRRREQIDRGCLVAVARAVEEWQAEYEASHGWAWYAMNDLDPPPLFLRGER